MNNAFQDCSADQMESLATHPGGTFFTKLSQNRRAVEATA